MNARTVITHALTQGTRVQGTSPMWGWRVTGTLESIDRAGQAVVRTSGGGACVLPASALSPVGGVSLVKVSDPLYAASLRSVLVMDMGTLHGWDTVAYVVPSLVKGVTCAWCEESATHTARGVWGAEHMCLTDAYRHGRFVETYVIRRGPGPVGARGAYVLDWGFMETV